MIQEIPYKYDPAYKDKKPELTDYLLHYELVCRTIGRPDRRSCRD